MSRIKSKDTKPEEVVRKYLFAHGFRYRKNDKELPGSPDIVLPKYKTVVFVNGCFWHAHEGCKWFTVPKSNTQFWISKFQVNKQRDQLDYEKLKDMGWKIEIVWECEIRHGDAETRLHSLVRSLSVK